MIIRKPDLSFITGRWKKIEKAKRVMLIGILLMIVGLVMPEVSRADITISSSTYNVPLRQLQWMCFTGFGNLNSSAAIREIAEYPCSMTNLFMVFSYGMAVAGVLIFAYGYRRRIYYPGGESKGDETP